MPAFQFTKYLCVLALLLLIGATADARTLSVKCGGDIGFSSIGAALKTLQGAESESSGSTIINVSGACRENILVQNLDRLTLNAVNGASISDASNGAKEVIDVANSKGFTLHGFTITTTCDAACLNGPGADAISCYFSAECLLINNSISGAGNGAGVGVYALSKVTVQGGSLQNNWAGLFTNDSGEMFVLGATIQNNHVGVFMNHGGTIAFRSGADGVTPNVISNNAGQGIFTNIGATLNLKAPMTVANNGADGVFLNLGANAFVGGGGPGVVTITGNGGSGVSVNDTSNALFGNGVQVTGNQQSDVSCSGQTSVTHGATTNIGGGTTNCTDQAPFSTIVNLSNAQVDPASGNTLVSAFVLTDSADPNCLLTFSESNNAVPGMVAFCGARAPFLYGGKPGGPIYVFFPAPVVNPLTFPVTVHPNGAKMYGQPVRRRPPGGCG